MEQLCQSLTGQTLLPYEVQARGSCAWLGMTAPTWLLPVSTPQLYRCQLSRHTAEKPHTCWLTTLTGAADSARSFKMWLLRWENVKFLGVQAND